jgi:long-chain acyl-CoA synthetase
MSIEEAHARLTAPGARFEMQTVAIRGVPTRVWKNAPGTLRDVFEQLDGYSARDCLVYGAERLSYTGFIRATRQLALKLQAAGVRRGDRVAIAMRNLPEWPALMFAASLCGAIVVPCNAWGTGPELEYALRFSGATLLFADGERLERVAPHLGACPSLQNVIATRVDEKSLDTEALTHATAIEDRLRLRLRLRLRQEIGVQTLETLLGPMSAWAELPVCELPEVAIAPDDDALIFFTSGTTGKPKGAVCTHRNACSNTLTTACAQARAALRRGQEPAPAPGPSSPQRALLLAVPMFHVMGCMPWLLAGLFNGSKLVLMHKWDAGQALRLIERERITQAGGVPMMAAQLLEHPERDQYDLSSLDSISVGGAPAAKILAGRLRETFPQARAANGWGMSEVASSYASNQAEDYVARPESCGVPAPTNDWKVMNAEGTHALPVGEVGELWVKGPQVMRGYWNDHEATKQSFEDGWLKTGDIAYLDAENFCYLVDRAKDMLIRGGENIYCVEVESVLHDHPFVLDVAVIGVPHELLGEEPAAVVQLRPGIDADESTAQALQAHTRAQLAAFKVPAQLRFTYEPLPRNPAGKLRKLELRGWFEPPPPAAATL